MSMIKITKNISVTTEGLTNNNHKYILIETPTVGLSFSYRQWLMGPLWE